MGAALRCVGAAVAAALLLAAMPAAASAHPMRTSAILLDVESAKVGGEVQLPLDRLAVALHRPLTRATAGGPLRASLERYTRSHIRVVGADGRDWRVGVDGGHVERIDGAHHLVMSLALTPPSGRVTDFSLRYDVIVEQLVTHKAIATIRTQWDNGTIARNAETLGVFDWNTSALRVDGDGGSWLRGVTATAGLGVEHIGEGADHLLFLLMLLIPAPLVARRGRWHRRDDARRSVIRVVHVVTAFAVGHSVTLAAATFGHRPPDAARREPDRAVDPRLRDPRPAAAGLRRRGDDRARLRAGPRPSRRCSATSGSRAARSCPRCSASTSASRSRSCSFVALMMPSLYVLSQTAVYGVVRVSIGSSASRSPEAGWSSARR